MSDIVAMGAACVVAVILAAAFFGFVAVVAMLLTYFLGKAYKRIFGEGDLF